MYVMFPIPSDTVHHEADRGLPTSVDQNTPSQRKVTVGTQDVLGCLGRSPSILAVQAEEVSLSLVYVEEVNSSRQINSPSTCWLQVVGQGHGVISMLIFNVTCLTANRLVIHSRMWNRHSFDCDPMSWLAPGTELTMTSNLANVSIEINDASTLFTLHALFKIFSSRGHNRMEIRNVTKYLGFIQTFSWTEDLHSHGHWSDTWELHVHLGHSVMLSVAQRDMDSFKSFLYFEKPNGDHFIRVKIERPVVIKTKQIRINCKLGPLGTFRVIYTFHNMTSQPMALKRGYGPWNCSVPFWSDFRHHLVCNGRKECLDGKDERGCPLLHPKEYGGLQLSGVHVAGSYFRLFATWHEEEQECKGRGGVRASLQNHEVWRYFWQKLKFHLSTRLRIQVGLVKTPKTLPHMYGRS